VELSRALAAGWSRRGANAVLLPVAGLFAALVAVRRAFYRRGWFKAERLPVPVIVVGNITAGGSGKTPVAIYLARELSRLGRRPGIVSRGYGGSGKDPRPVSCDSDPRDVGDEPVLLARRGGCPVFVGHDRVAAARALLAGNPRCDVVISDDGLQHLRLAREMEIVVVDSRGFGNGWPLPAGPLRECPHRIATADAVVLNGDSAALPTDIAGPPVFRMSLAGALLRNVRNPARSCAPENLRGLSLHAVAGIGEPERFFRSIEQFGLRAATHAFPDHHPFGASDLVFDDADALLMTEKDAVKCGDFAPENAWYLPVEAKLAPDLAEWVAAQLNR